MNNILDLISNTICSENFKDSLSSILFSYPNLKQESLIRNLIMERLNQRLDISNIRAFAEHPRIKGNRVDLSIVCKEDLINPIKIEFKFQFSGDYKNFKDYKNTIKNDFEVRQSDIFILVIQHTYLEGKNLFDKEWGISSNLGRYIAKDDSWKTNILTCLQSFENSQLIEIEKIEISQPFQSEYYFYILSKSPH